MRWSNTFGTSKASLTSSYSPSLSNSTLNSNSNSNSYSHSHSHSNQLKRKRRRHYDSSSSSSDSSSDENELRKPEIKALGRKLNLLKDGALVTRDCQFVKKILVDPYLAGSVNEKPTFIKGDSISNINNGDDPRGKGKLEPQKEFVFKPVLFLWDSNSKGTLPCTSILITKINVASKSLLMAMLTSITGVDVTTGIREILLRKDTALLRVSDPSLAVLLVKKVDGVQGWSVSFDPGEQLWQSKIESNTMPTIPKDVVKLQDNQKTKEDDTKDLLKCSARVPCLLIGYKIISETESRRTLERIFRKCHIFNTERGEDGWHVHLTTQAEIDFAERWREDFYLDDKRIPFRIEYFKEPPRRLLDIVDSKIKEAKDHHHIIDEQVKRKEFKVQVTNSSRSSMRSSIDSLYNATTILSSASLTPLTDDSTTLPSFNRKVLERLRVEEEAAAQAAAEVASQAAEAARLVLESKLAAEAIRQEKRRLKELKQEEAKPIPVAPVIPELPTLDLLESGCARLEGYWKQDPCTKVNVYLEDILKTYAKSTIVDSQPQGRSARAVNRRQQHSYESLQGTALSARKKHLTLGRSSIHSWGLYALEDIEAGDMVIEYVGELIRHPLADLRERLYESLSQSCSYFFKLDDTYVVDATHKGNLARFVNHSCDPTCVARVITLEGAKRIVMYARRDIRRGEEITYDYKFSIDDDPAKKIPCLCGARTCRGSLN